ncbi:ammonium transporter [Dissulfurirhabdus thermomarina]|uniref:Ammonium transporter n=1 Tax=Dissulfurirhabdus thermomarina TaxID=1765737 RepID=A0A6N9TML9_DISTH|nr:ammonium transporter [Dissulfurirhabdus thermomarina]NDY42485.1 ammonium transporter [Dissulfurirhabdus thermomarina]NMX22878.1 ammonium transporter [Dissulfurirhabdus thermomarina]
MIQAGDTAFILVAAALVLLMTPGLALFYGGMVRGKNVLGTIMQSFIMIAVVSLEWVYLGYSLSFGPDVGGLIGGLAKAGLSGVGAAPNPDYAATIPESVFMIYQCMFAVITPALITGAFAERMRFGPFLLFSLLWTVLVYDPVCHWIWGAGGWLKARGVLDFAGGLVVHLTSGTAALAAALVLGRRKGYGREQFLPHNLPMTLLGAGLLWFGWFGFNGGSALAADGVAATAFVATHLAGMAGMAMWVLVEWVHRGRPTTLGAASGAIAGLATVTPASGFVGPNAAVVIGLLAGGLCYVGVLAKGWFRYDDSLDVVGIHGLGGVLGTLCLGLFASKAVNPGGADGLLAGNAAFLGTQAFAVAVVAGYAFVLSFVLLKAIDLAWGLRLAPEAETEGLDLSEHNEAAYNA